MSSNSIGSLAARLRGGEFVTAPGVFELISARIADRMGFPALYMTGYGTVASHLGLPDAGLATYSDMVDRVTRICQTTQTPVIADADTGYGGLLNVQHTVRGYERAGAAAIQLEDQEVPKKCGHTPGRRVIPTEDMVAKIKVAVETRQSPDFLIVGRTDARTEQGLGEAIQRGRAYAAAGADIIFIEAPESLEEMQEIAGSFPDKPLLANMVEGGKTPVLSANELRDIGYSLAIFPATAFLAAAETLRQVYEHFLLEGSSSGLVPPLYNFEAFSALMGFEDVWAFEERWAKRE